MLEEVVGLGAVDGFKGIEVFKKDLLWERGDTEGDFFHGSAMVGSTGDGELNSLSWGMSMSCLAGISW